MVSQSSPLYNLIWRAVRYEVFRPDVNYNLILLQLIRRFDASLVEIKHLIVLGADVNYQDPEGYTPLMIAADAQNDRVVEYLVKNNATPLLQNKYKELASDLVSSNSALYSYLKQKEKEYRMDSTLSDEEKYSIMLQEYVVNSNAKTQIIDEYIKHGYDINYQNIEVNYTLFLAVYSQNYRVAEYLLNQGYDPFLEKKFYKKPSDIVSRTSSFFKF